MSTDGQCTRTDSTDVTTGPFLLSISVFWFLVSFIILFCSVPCGRLSWLLVSFWTHVNIVSRIVSYRIVTDAAIKPLSRICFTTLNERVGSGHGSKILTLSLSHASQRQIKQHNGESIMFYDNVCDPQNVADSGIRHTVSSRIHCLEWQKSVLTNLYHDRQLFNTLIA